MYTVIYVLMNLTSFLKLYMRCLRGARQMNSSRLARPSSNKTLALLFFANYLTTRQLISVGSMAELVGFLESQYGAITKKLENMVKEGVISYKGLWYLFAKGKKVYGRTGKLINRLVHNSR